MYSSHRVQVPRSPRYRGLKMGNRTRSAGLLAAAIGLLLVVSACGSSAPVSNNDDGTPTGSADTVTGQEEPSSPDVPSDDVLTLNVGVGSSAVDYGAFWVADAKNLFAEEGLDIQATYNTSSGSANLVASGQVDVQLYTMPLGLQIAGQGKQISMIYALSRFDATSFAIAGSQDVTSVADLAAIGDGCRIGNTGQGSGTYAYMNAFLTGHDVDCEPVSLADVPSVISAVSAGSVNAASIPYNVAMAAADEGKLNIIVDPANMTEEEADKIVPTPYPAYAIFGLKSQLEKQPEAVERFIRALNKGSAILHDSTPGELADMLLTLEPFKGVERDTLEGSWSTSLGRFPSGDQGGFLSPDDYAASLAGFESWGLPEYEPTKPELAYDQVVDMSYWDAASK